MANKKFSDYVVAGDNITLTYDNNADTVTIDAAGNVDSVNGKVGVVVLNKTDIGLSNVDNTSDVNKAISTATQIALDGKASTTSLNAHTSDLNNPHAVTKSQVGLSNVDNTSDANKPISTATQTALNGKQDTLVSGTNIKTVNSNSLVGSGNVVIDKTSVGLGNVTNVDTTNASNISSGTLSDSRLSANVTTQGNTFNAANKLVQLDATAKLPAVDGSQLTNLPSFTPPNGLLKIASAISTTFQAVTDYLGTASVLFLNSRRVGIGKDTSVTTQSVAVVEVQDTNTSIVLKPNGTGAIIASVPDGTVTGGNARGTNAVDLQTTRTAATNVASGINSTIAGGATNTASSNYSTISGGQSNTASTNTHATVVGGQSNTSSGQHSLSGGFTNVVSGQYNVGFGNNNNTSGTGAFALGSSNTVIGNGSTENSLAIGESNNVSNSRGNFAFGKSNTISGSGVGQTIIGRSNTISASFLENCIVGVGNNISSTSIRSYAFGFQNSISSGNNSVVLGVGNAMSGQGNMALATGCEWLSGDYSTSIGISPSPYLRNQFVHGAVGNSPRRGRIQISNLIAYNDGILTTAATTTLSLDGTGTTNLIIPEGNNRAWNVQIDTIAVVTAITGTATGVSVGDVYRETKQLLFKRIGGTSSIVGTVDTTAIKSDTSMSTAALTVTAGASQQMALTFTAPTFAGGGSVTCRVVSKVSLVEVAY